jgi:hypothetical protein
MLEYWNNGMTPFWQINACGEDGWNHCFYRGFLFDNQCMKWFYSIIPGGKKENGGVAILYYQAFLEISIY